MGLELQRGLRVNTSSFIKTIVSAGDSRPRQPQHARHRTGEQGLCAPARPLTREATGISLQADAPGWLKIAEIEPNTPSSNVSTSAFQARGRKIEVWLAHREQRQTEIN